jgi:cyclopropane-fatty-acyl-phospholipid synthase
MVIHAALHYDARAVGITISKAQAALARQRVAEAGVADRVEIRLLDYRDLRGEKFDAISSVGMSEHVGHDKLDRYFETLRQALGPQGRLLNHAISSVGGSTLGPRSFVGRYVFPDGELIDVGDTVLAMERAGCAMSSAARALCHTPVLGRTSRRTGIRRSSSSASQGPRSGVLMAGRPSVRGRWIAIHQLGVVPTETGNAAMPAMRRGGADASERDLRDRVDRRAGRPPTIVPLMR